MFELPEPRREPNPKNDKPSRTYRNPIFLAREWQNALDHGDCPSKAALARELGVSRARVTQVLRLLRLDPEVLDAIIALGDPLLSPIVTERRLRPIVGLPPKDQRRKISAFLAGEARVL